MTTMQTARKLILGAVAAAAMAMTGAAQADIKPAKSALGQLASRGVSVSGAPYESAVNALTSQAVDVTGIQSFGEYGDAGNVVLNFYVGAFATITSVDWNVNLTANDLDFRSNYVQGDQWPAGLTVASAQATPGAARAAGPAPY